MRCGMMLAESDNAYSAALWGNLVQETIRVAVGKCKSVSVCMCEMLDGVGGRTVG